MGQGSAKYLLYFLHVMVEILDLAGLFIATTELFSALLLTGYLEEVIVETIVRSQEERMRSCQDASGATFNSSPEGNGSRNALEAAGRPSRTTLNGGGSRGNESWPYSSVILENMLVKRDDTDFVGRFSMYFDASMRRRGYLEIAQCLPRKSKVTSWWCHGDIPGPTRASRPAKMRSDLNGYVVASDFVGRDHGARGHTRALSLDALV